MESGLAGWFSLWHSRYRLLIVQLFLAGTLAAGMVYVQNYLLTSLTLSLGVGEASLEVKQTASLSGETGTQEQTISPFLTRLAAPFKVNLPLFLLLLYILANLLSAALEFWRIRSNGVLRIKTRNDIETEILTHLLGKDDAFFAIHSPAETVNRITVDLNRVCEFRCNVMRVWWSGVLILGYVVFFLLKDWRLAFFAIASCVTVAVWTYRLTRRIKHLDRTYLHEDDRVKSQFEDFLRATPEIQVGHLYGKARGIFRKSQDERTGIYLRFLNLSGALRIGDLLSALLAFVGTIAVVIYMKHTGEASLALALLPVMIMSLPALFKNSSDLIYLNVDFQLARTSKDRLMDYETHGPVPVPSGEDELTGPPAAPATLTDALRPPASLRLQQVTYLYKNPDRPQQGGVAGIDLEFRPRRWVAVAGRVGSGKSTLVNLLLGRLKPQGGRILYGDETLRDSRDGRFSSIFSFMPQSLALLNTTIKENLLFGQIVEAAAAPSPGLTGADLELLETAGLGQVCRLKALDLPPGDPAAYPDLALNIGEVRDRARAYFATPGGAVLKYEDGHPDRNFWILEILIRGKCDRGRVARTLVGEGNGGELKPLAPTRLAGELVALGQRLLEETRDLLELSNFHLFSQMARAHLDEQIWKLRRASLRLTGSRVLSPQEQLDLAAVALTCSPGEFPGGDAFLKKWQRPDFQKPFVAEIDGLKEIIGDSWRPFAPAAINPYLTWRENLVFGVSDRLANDAVLDFIDGEGLSPLFTRLGLEFGVGRLGSNLSGGQGQLLALCRTLLRRTPVLILDEPTSHLDPISSAKVARLLHAWKAERIVITVSHDPDFVRYADEIVLMDEGRIVTVGSFQEVAAKSELFRRAFGAN